jgi:hypothetical protein
VSECVSVRVSVRCVQASVGVANLQRMLEVQSWSELPKVDRYHAKSIDKCVPNVFLTCSYIH